MYLLLELRILVKKHRPNFPLIFGIVLFGLFANMPRVSAVPVQPIKPQTFINYGLINQELLKQTTTPTQTLQAEQYQELSKLTFKPAKAPVAPQNTAGNTYTRLYCTWHVKNLLSWVENGWGNANMWGSNARQQGFVVSRDPIVGSVAQTSSGSLGHVAVVIAVGNGSVTVDEMNYKGLGIRNTRTTSTSDWVYIYPPK